MTLHRSGTWEQADKVSSIQRAAPCGHSARFAASSLSRRTARLTAQEGQAESAAAGARGAARSRCGGGGGAGAQTSAVRSPLAAEAMSKGFGSRADMLSTKFDEVSRNSIWREHCEKEQAMAGLDQDRDFVITNPHSSTCPVVCSLPRERGARRSRARNAARCGACCRPRRAGGVLGVWLLRLRDQVGQGGRQGRAGDTPSRGERVPFARSVGFGSVSGRGRGKLVAPWPLLRGRANAANDAPRRSARRQWVGTLWDGHCAEPAFAPAT